MDKKYTAPEFKRNAFHCAHCEVYAHQTWSDVLYRQGYGVISGLVISLCGRCGKDSIWFGGKMIYPVSSNAPLPVEDMPENVKEDFSEARNIVNASPRSAAALLRLALQKLMVHLGEQGENINEDIANLVKKGLPSKIQKALDAVRVIGNNAVHPGEIDLKDDIQTAITLFALLNMIVEVMIIQPKEVDQIYDKIPTSTKESIQKRDAGV